MITFLIIIAFIVLLFGVNSIFIVPREIEKFIHLVEEEKYDEAMGIYQQGLINRSYNPEVSYGLARIYEHRKEWYLAVSQYQRILKGGKFPPQTDEIVIRLKKVEANKMLHHYDEIAEDCYAILKIEPEHYAANFEIGKRLFSLKNYHAARPYLEQINRNDNREILECLIDIEIEAKNFKKAILYIDELKRILQGKLPEEILYKMILIYFNLADYPKVIEISHQFLPDARIPIVVGVTLGISYFHTQDYQQALKYFDIYLKNFVDDHSQTILEGRYLFSNLLIERGNLQQAYIQTRFIEQLNPNYRDVSHRKNILAQINEYPEVREILSKINMENIANDVIKFEFPEFYFIKNRLIFNGDLVSKKKWFIISITTDVDKDFHLFVSINMEPYDNNDIGKILDMVREKINDNYRILNFIFLTLSGIGIESEKILMQTFNNCYFYNQENFISHFRNRQLPILAD